MTKRSLVQAHQRFEGYKEEGTRKLCLLPASSCCSLSFLFDTEDEGIIVKCMGGYRRSLDWIFDLLTTYRSY
jgi:hypothetical protein